MAHVCLIYPPLIASAPMLGYETHVHVQKVVRSWYPTTSRFCVSELRK